MKTLIPSLCATLLLLGCNDGNPPAAGTTADSPPASAATAPGADAEAKTASATGTVETVEPAAGRIVIAHGPVEALNWPAMTMGFSATAEQAGSVKPGDQVRFEFRQDGSRYVITRIERTD